MTVILRVKRYRDPTIWERYTFDWPCVPRIGDYFTLPDRAVNGHHECEVTGTVKLVYWEYNVDAELRAQVVVEVMT